MVTVVEARQKSTAKELLALLPPVQVVITARSHDAKDELKRRDLLDHGMLWRALTADQPQPVLAKHVPGHVEAAWASRMAFASVRETGALGGVCAVG
jgi:hypothetical protein